MSQQLWVLELNYAGRKVMCKQNSCIWLWLQMTRMQFPMHFPLSFSLQENEILPTRHLSLSCFMVVESKQSGIECSVSLWIIDVVPNLESSEGLPSKYA